MRPHAFVLVLVGLFGNDLGFRSTENVKRSPRSFQGATITGQLVDARTFQPLRGAIVAAPRVPVSKPGAPPNTGFRTGEDGKFILRGVAPGIVNFSVFKAGYAAGPFASVRPAVDGEQINNVILTVPPGASVSGRILDESGQPVAGLQVAVRANLPMAATLAQSIRGTATTTEDGRYLVGGLSTGEYTITLGSLSESVEVINDVATMTKSPRDLVGTQSRIVTLATGEERGDVDLMIRFRHRYTGPRPLDYGSATIEGRVVDGSGVGIPHAVVLLRQAEKGGGSIASRADAAGRFQFQNMPAGSFIVGPARFSVNVAGIGAAGESVTVRVGTGSRTENVVLTASRGGTISGTITDEFGDPALAAIMVLSPMRPELSAEAISVVTRPDGVQVFGRSAAADSHGRYRITELPPGEYVVNVLPVDLMTARTEVHFTDSAGQDRILSPGWLFYPGVMTVTQASKVAVSENRESTGVDMSVRPLMTTSIIVTATAARPVGEIQLQQILLDDMLPLPENITRMTDSTVTLEARPGRYRLLASAEVASTADNVVRLWASAEVDTDPSIPATVTMHLEPGANISGRIVFEGTESNRQNSGARLTPLSSLPLLPVSLTAATRGNTMFEPATGLFSIEGILPGRYVIQAGGGTRERVLWTLKSAMIGGRDVLDEPIDLRPGEEIDDVRLTVTDRVTDLSGKVSGASTRPVSLEWVVAFAADKKHWWPGSRRIRSVRPDATGAYTIRGLPPGTYVVTVVSDPVVLSDPAKLVALAVTDTRVTLAEGERKVQDLRWGK